MATQLETDLPLSPTPAQLDWLETQLRATAHVAGDAQTRCQNPGEESLFGLPMATILRAVPAAAGLSSYVSLGMARLSAGRLRALLRDSSFQYRVTTNTGIRFVGQHLYTSGIPDAYLDVSGLTVPGGFPIRGLRFYKQKDAWRVVVLQRLRPPKPPLVGK